MRYGIVRRIEGHLPLPAQRALIERAGCDVLLEEGPPTRPLLKAQLDLLFSLKRGDELLICSLAILHLTTGQLVRLFRRFDQTGVVLRLVGDKVLTLTLSGPTRALLALLATNEPSPAELRSPRARARTKGKPLSLYQLDYARELKRRGASLRMIGLLFQTSPSELQRLMGQADGPGGPASGPAGRRLKALDPDVSVTNQPLLLPTAPERRRRANP
ncbi:hypothetical protein [Phenylobacterium sp.]|uniref:hypothetical protein n=1 Tax=Phenylobacterium sp. TaxID=1871053 RepID=UPI00286D43AD|nr:hypothetical protein [Phenylobacterium sp.]